MTDVATTAGVDRFAAARSVADATLYEGYVLYPYRVSSAKNRVRWQFGVLAPRAWAEADGSERWKLRTECICDPGPSPDLWVRVRFLQLQSRIVQAAGPNGYEPVESLLVGGVRWVPWDEAVERVVEVGPCKVLPVASSHHEAEFAFGADGSTEDLVDDDGTVVGRIVRRTDDCVGTVTIDAEWAEGYSPLAKLTVAVTNRSDAVGHGATRDEALAHSLLGVHALLGLDGGSFVSSIDPPTDAVEAVAGCTNDGSFPVLVADPSGGPDVMLSSPITLYDHPEVAPESQGDLYDSTEIDEILALRIMTLTDEEKAEARGTDPRAAAIVDRCDNMPPEMWARLHGAVRELGPARDLGEVPSFATPTDAAPAVAEEAAKPWWDPATDAEFDPWTDSVRIGEVDVAQGTKVILRPNRRSDSHDFFLAGMAATVAGVFHDVDGTLQVGVTVDDDPATEELAWQGRYLFFFPDEIEVVS